MTPQLYCCPEFARACEDGTDNEGYGALLGGYSVSFPPKSSDYTGQWELGYDLPPIRFCPWCGKHPIAYRHDEPRA